MGAGKRVLIVGGGIAGLSLGRALRQRGIDAEIAERAGEWSPGGAGIYIPGNGMRALDELGLAEPLLARGRVNERRRFLTAEGTTSFEVDLVDFWSGVGPCLGVSRAGLHDVLLAGAQGVTVRLGTTVDVLKEDARGVTAVFTDGSEGHYDLVVGADGIHSSIRRLLVEQPLGRADLASASWRFLVTCPQTVDCWTLLAGADALLLMVPIEHGRAYCWAAFTARQQVLQRPDHARFQSAFSGFADPAAEVIGQVDDPDRLHYSPIEEVSRPVWGRGRTVLVGDAAHAMPPTMAQGASLAVEDAVVLAELLAETSDWTDVAARFEARRAPRIAWVKEHTSRQARLLNLPYGLRKLAIRLVGEKLWRRSFAPLRDPA